MYYIHIKFCTVIKTNAILEDSCKLNVEIIKIWIENVIII